METKNIHKRILDVMKAVSYVQKEDKRVNNQYRYVSHDAVTAAIRPALIDAGIVVETTLESVTTEPTHTDKLTSDGKVSEIVRGYKTEAIYQVAFVNADDPKDRVVVRALGIGIDPRDVGPGKACSYAFKYALLKLFCLETGDDPERDAVADPTAQVLTPVGQATKARKAYTPTASPKPPTPAPKPQDEAPTLPDGGISPDAKAWAKQTLYAAGIIQQDRASLTPLLQDNPKTKRAAELLLADMDLTI